MSEDFTVPSKQIMPIEDYHAHPAVGSSSLKHILRSAAHYKWHKDNPKVSTAAMDFGTAVHLAILENEKFEENALIMPNFSGTGSRAAKEEFLLKNHGKLILKQDDFDAVTQILRNVRSNKVVSQYLSTGAAEESYFWQDPDSGIVCKCRPDYLRKGHIVVDVKTTRDASQDGFAREVAKYKYHVSAAMYLDGVSAVLNQKFDEFIILAIEKEPPYAMNLHLLDSGTVEAGRMLYKRALRQLAECKRTGQYPAYTEKLLTLSLPAYAFPSIDIEDFEEVG